VEVTVTLDQRTEVMAVHFKETPAHSSFDWHDAPERQYVLTLSGTLEFTTRDGETFVLRPGDVLVATDDVGSGHRWQLIDDQPWRRCYVVLKPGALTCSCRSGSAPQVGQIDRELASRQTRGPARRNNDMDLTRQHYTKQISGPVCAGRATP
jgi:quercetin dioxygenase-like cupin family protein